MKTVRQILERKKVVYAFGRMNPPTRGHQFLIQRVLEIAKKENAEPRVYVSFSKDESKNPLTRSQKIKYLKLGIPKAAEHIVEDTKVLNPFQAMESLQSEGYTDVVFVVGEDRYQEFKKDFSNYFGKPGRKDIFKSFRVEKVGSRNANGNAVERVSGTMMREYAANNDFGKFFKSCPSELSEHFAKEMFKSVRKGLNLSEEVAYVKKSLNIPRDLMPQIKEKDIEEFIENLEKKGIPILKKSLAVADLKPTQREINLDKVKKKIDSLTSGEADIKPFIVSIDNYILDGHHQLFALRDINKGKKVLSYVIGLKMEDLLRHAKGYSKTSYKNIAE